MKILNKLPFCCEVTQENIDKLYKAGFDMSNLESCFDTDKVLAEDIYNSSLYKSTDVLVVHTSLKVSWDGIEGRKPEKIKIKSIRRKV